MLLISMETFIPSGIIENKLNLEFIDINTSKHMQCLNLITNTVSVKEVE